MVVVVGGGGGVKRFRKVYPQHSCLDFSWNSPVLSILFEILNTDVMQDDASDMLQFLQKYYEMVRIGTKKRYWGSFCNFFCLRNLLHSMNYTSRFCQMKVKNFCIDSPSMKWPLFGFYGAHSPQILFGRAENLTSGRPIRQTHC